jgi:magnesium-transporting ATPase (P-type)
VSDDRSTVSAPAEPWHRDANDVAYELGTDTRRGLSGGEAAARLKRYGLNQLDAAVEIPSWRTFLGQFANPIIYLLLGAIAI